jgi:hypothetical protein
LKVAAEVVRSARKQHVLIYNTADTFSTRDWKEYMRAEAASLIDAQYQQLQSMDLDSFVQCAIDVTEGMDNKTLFNWFRTIEDGLER